MNYKNWKVKKTHSGVILSSEDGELCSMTAENFLEWLLSLSSPVTLENGRILSPLSVSCDVKSNIFRETPLNLSLIPRGKELDTSQLIDRMIVSNGESFWLVLLGRRFILLSLDPKSFFKKKAFPEILFLKIDPVKYWTKNLLKPQLPFFEIKKDIPGKLQFISMASEKSVVEIINGTKRGFPEYTVKYMLLSIISPNLNPMNTAIFLQSTKKDQELTLKCTNSTPALPGQVFIDSENRIGVIRRSLGRESCAYRFFVNRETLISALNSEEDVSFEFEHDCVELDSYIKSNHPLAINGFRIIEKGEKNDH